ncbi:MAG: TM2 domain-containing protein [Bacteroidetes bacterium]|nr:TM2 domain-containing protein [Bacteroidota bacterium]
MQKFKALLATFCIFLGLFAVLFFRFYRGHIIPYPLLWLLISGFFSLAGFILLLSVKKNTDKKKADDLFTVISRIKKEGEKIPVNLRECEVKSNSWVETVDKNQNRSDAVDLALIAIGGTGALISSALRNSNSEKEISRQQSVIIFKHNNEIFRSPVMDREEITLKMLIDIHEKTFIYRDRKDRRKYYFDLEFLDKK